MENEIGIIIYAPGLVANDGRPLAVIHGMERAFPGLRLHWTISDEGEFVPLARRDEFVTRGEIYEGTGFPLVCNGGGDGELVTLWGSTTPALIAPGGRELFDFHADLPHNATGVAVAPAMLEAVAEAARAFWGHATPYEAAVDIAGQTQNLPKKLEPPPRGLPVLMGPGFRRSPEIPGYLGWLNYWSAASARIIGFPDPARDAELLSRSRRTASGGWVVQLTDDPLDLERPEHLAALKQVYDRFLEIGGRA